MDGSTAPSPDWWKLPSRMMAAHDTSGQGSTANGGAAPDAGTRALFNALKALKPPTTSTGLIDQLRGLEDLKSAIAGMQAQIAVAVDVLERASQADAGIPAPEQGKSVGAQIALARRESPAHRSRLLGLARALVTEMPHTLAALHNGHLSEWRATLLVKETACLSSADRAAVDEELSPDTGTFSGHGDKTLIAAARAAAYRRDPRSVVNRAAHAASER